MRSSFVSLIICPLLQLWQRPPHSDLLVVLNRHFHSKDVIEIFEQISFFKKMKESTHKQTTFIHNSLSGIAIPYKILLYSVVFSFSVYAIRCLLKKKIINALRWKRQLQLCPHGNQLGGNNFAFIKFKVGFDYHSGKIELQQSSDILLNLFNVISVKTLRKIFPLTQNMILMEGTFCFLLHTC